MQDRKRSCQVELNRGGVISHMALDLSDGIGGVGVNLGLK